jgi:hypothetical protein
MRRKRQEVRYGCPVKTMKDRHDHTKGEYKFTGCEKRLVADQNL